MTVSRKRLLLLVSVAILLTIIVVTFVLYKKVQNVSNNKQIENKNSFTQKVAEKNLEIKELPSLDKRLGYEVHGLLSKPLYFQGDVLVGEMIINGDSTKSPLKMILGVKNGNIVFGIKENGITTFKPTAAEGVFNVSRDYNKVFLRFFVETDPEKIEQGPEFQQQAETSYNVIKNFVETGVVDSEVSLLPTMFGFEK